MALSMAPNSLATLVAGLVLALLGLGLLIARFRNRGALSFGIFSFGFGASIALLPFEPPAGSPAFAVWDALGIVARLVYVVGLLGVFLYVPEPLRRTERASKLAFAAGAAAWIVFSTTRAGFDAEFRVTGAPTFLDGAGLLASRITSATLLGSLFAHPFRFGILEEHAARRSLALLTIGLVLFTTGNAGNLLVRLTPGGIASVAGVLACAVVWLARTGGPDGRLARNVALAIPACLLANMLVTLLLPEFAIPAGRLGAVAFLAYAVLRGLIAGLDTKVHFAISKGTVAAIFVAVFFLASELAQQFFAQRYSALAGIAAAGTLVFALSPLQRAAERLAERAVPLTEPSRAHATSAGEVYKSALRAAMRDGVITRREEKHLAEVARGLGLDPVEAHELRDQVETEN